jgi:hypothetical protein
MAMDGVQVVPEFRSYISPNKCEPLDVSPDLLLEGKNEPHITIIEPVTYTHPSC